MKDNKKVKSAIPAVVMISLALAIRQMSMTIVMPFISTYCKALIGYTPFLAGLAVGIFGLMQAVFQIPFGILSDKCGNKKMMLLGLTQVIIGLILAYSAHSIGMLIFARALQGSGAIIGVGYSWAAGIAGENERVRAMSILGAFVSASAALAFALGPLLRGFLSVRWMFLSSSILLFLNALYILFFMKDSRNTATNNRNTETNYRNIETNNQNTVTNICNTKTTNQKAPGKNVIRILLRDRCFLSMNLAAFLNNYMMIAIFYAVPMYLVKVTGENGMWKIFVPAIITAILVMKLTVRWSQKGYSHRILMISFLVSAFSIFFYFNKASYLFLLAGTTFFLCGYITLATLVATVVNNIAKDNYRGTANGIFNSFQYVGNFAGAVVTGALWGISESLMWIVTIGVGLAGFLVIAFNQSSQTNSSSK